jgi:hypothetical protein
VEFFGRVESGGVDWDFWVCAEVGLIRVIVSNCCAYDVNFQDFPGAEAWCEAETGFDSVVLYAEEVYNTPFK